MAEKLRRITGAALVVASIYLITLVAIAWITQTQLTAVTAHADLMSDLMLLTVSVLPASGVAPALALLGLRVRSFSAYFANAIVSAALGFYTVLAADVSAEYSSGAQPFRDTLNETFSGFANISFVHILFFYPAAAVATIASLIGCVVFWRTSARAAKKRAQTA